MKKEGNICLEGWLENSLEKVKFFSSPEGKNNRGKSMQAIINMSVCVYVCI